MYLLSATCSGVFVVSCLLLLLTIGCGSALLNSASGVGAGAGAGGMEAMLGELLGPNGAHLVQLLVVSLAAWSGVEFI